MGIVNLKENKTLGVGVVKKNIQDENTIIEAGTIVYNLRYKFFADEGYIQLHDFETNEIALIKMNEKEFDHIETYIDFDPILTNKTEKIMHIIDILCYLSFCILLILFGISLYFALKNSVPAFIGLLLIGWFVLAFFAGNEANERLIRSKKIRNRIVKLKKITYSPMGNKLKGGKQ